MLPLDPRNNIAPALGGKLEIITILGQFAYT
jgi:hypothetical protein